MYQSTCFSSNKLKFTTRQINLPTTFTHMKTLQLLFLLPLSILCSKSTAQVDDLMRNKNITWIAESYNDFTTDASAEEKIGKRISGSKLLKFYNPTEGDMPEEFFLQYLILELAQNKKISIYKDDKCTQPVSYEIASGGIDTSTLHDPTTYETKCTLGRGYVDIESLIFFRAHQIFYYDSAKIQFGLRTLAIAPMRREANERGETIGWMPLFWIKVTDLKEKRNLSDESVTWAKRMILTNGVLLKTDSVKVLKTFGENEPVASLFHAIKKKPEIPFYDPYYGSIKTEFSATRRADFFTAKDTAKPFDIETYNSDEHHFPTSGIKVTDAKALRILQNWYWDDKKQQIEIWLSAVAPLIEVKDEAGEFLYKYPLFYRRTDD
jgi:Gliding motility associated protein GldN